MDSKNLKEFQYFAINTPGKWRQGFCESIFIDPDGLISLTPKLNITEHSTIGYATGLTVDNNGNLYIIDAASCAIYLYSSKSNELKRLECIERCGYDECGQIISPGFTPAPEESLPLFECGIESGQFKFSGDCNIFAGGFAFGKSTLYIADTYNHRIQAFYRPGFQIRFVLGKIDHCEPVAGSDAGEFNEPRDIVLDSKGHLYILDFGNERIQKFTQYGRFLLSFGKNLNNPLQKPAGLAIDGDDFIYVTDSARATVEKFDNTGNWIDTIINFSRLSLQVIPSAIAVDQKSHIYVGENRSQNTAYIHQFDNNGAYRGYFGSYSGSCNKLLFDNQGNLYGSFDGKVFLFGGDKNFEKQGDYYSRVFDSTISGCKWHRIALDIQPAKNSTIGVFFRTAEKSEDIDKQEWSDIILQTPYNSIDVNEALLSNIPGRYLQLKFEIAGNGAQSSKIKQAQIYFQRLSYLRYLPAVYQEDENGKDFLERFLSIFETMFYDLEMKIDHITKYFDPQAVDSEFLNWLSSWLVVMNDDNWPESTRRTWLENAYQLYKLRGTIQGLIKIITIFTRGRVNIIEHFWFKSPMLLKVNSIIGRSTVVGTDYTRRLVLEESSRIGEFVLTDTEDSPEKPFQTHAYDFTILADTSQLENDEQIKALRRLVEQEIPAHTRCFLRTTEDAVMQLGVHALLGVDTRLSRGFEPMELGKTSFLGTKSFLGSKYRRRGTIGMRSKIAFNTRLH